MIGTSEKYFFDFQQVKPGERLTFLSSGYVGNPRLLRGFYTKGNNWGTLLLIPLHLNFS